MSDIEKYVDKAMFPAATMKNNEPTAYLLWMTPDPLGAVACAVRMYKGVPTYSMNDITDEERVDAWEGVQKTRLTAPLEFVKLHFFLEGVDRAFTHQLVRQRTAVYAQESLRFAVKEDLSEETSRPPSLSNPAFSQSKRNDLEDTWNSSMEMIGDAYATLIANGMPAEDARGLLPQATLTRLNYCTDLRNLSEHAGNRLCTQAQFHWRQAFMSIKDAIGNFGFMGKDQWQFELIADSNLFKPVCYQIGKCGFKAEFDRGCTIRERVDFFEKHGIPSNEWDRYGDDERTPGGKIREAEWLLDPQAGWVK